VTQVKKLDLQHHSWQLEVRAATTKWSWLVVRYKITVSAATITPDNTKKFYGDNDPTFTYTTILSFAFQ
jgi:oligoribonuclease NrnB/cAMP/cGMP phosphodiesterase (DHH superfamily)